MSNDNDSKFDKSRQYVWDHKSGTWKNPAGDSLGTGARKWKSLCKHSGNVGVFITSEYSGVLFAGGWTRFAYPDPEMVVIDLEGEYFEDRIQVNDAARPLFKSLNTQMNPAIHLHIRDYDVPAWGVSFWMRFAEDVGAILESGADILVACTGGHGRTGMVVAILAGILVPAKVGDDPVSWIRKVYCPEAIETRAQEKYTRKIVAQARELTGG